MTPEEKTEFENMKKRLTALEKVQNVPFIENMKRRLFGNDSWIKKDSSDDDTSGITVGGAASSAKPFDEYFSYLDENNERRYVGTYTSV